MAKERVNRINSLLKEVISEVIRKELKHSEVNELLTVTAVDVSKDLRHAKVYISVIGSEKDKETTMAALEKAAGFIGSHASKKVVLRYFPELKFYLDNTVDKQLRIDELLKEIDEERNSRTEQ